MKASSPRKAKARYSDPSTPGLTPLNEAFAQSQIPTASRAQSLSPKKRDSKQPLHIRMNLTETQMDRVTEAYAKGNPLQYVQTLTVPRFTAKVVSSPTTRSQRATHSSASKSVPRGYKSSPSKHYRNKYSLGSNVSDSTTFSDVMPRPQHEGSANSLAERRQKATPAPILTEGGPRPNGTLLHRPHLEAVPNMVSPLSPRQMYEAGRVNTNNESIYSPDYYPSPLKPIIKLDDPFNGGQYATNNATFNEYNDWARQQSPVPSPSRNGGKSPAHRPRRSKSTGEGLRQSNEFISPMPQLQPSPQKQAVESPLFSPFLFYFRGDFPQEKKGGKTMIGDKGWLERTDPVEEKAKKTGMKKGILDGIKKIAKDMSELHNPGRRAHNLFKEPIVMQIAISLDAREQSLLYGELEYHLTNALNTFITIQLEKGRLVTDKLKKVGDAWLAQGRPRVVGFRYDLETQLELTSLHVEEFVFFGRRQGNPVEISGVLHAMKVNARAMRIRTFCQPDSVIAKQIVDAQSLFNMIGVAKVADLAMAEIAQFFKVCVEREQEVREQERNKPRKSMFVHQKLIDEQEERGSYAAQGPQGCSDDDWRYKAT